MNQPWVVNLDESTLGIKPGGTNPGLNLDEPTLGNKPG